MFDRLAEPFPADAISWRVGSTTKGENPKGMALAYLDARDVMDRFDFVCGPGGWQCRYSHANGKTVCDIGVRVERDGGTADWVWKADGAGDTDVEAEKGALSDAFKRAAVRWGVGRYLYGLSSPWVTIEPFGRSFKIKDSEHAKLRTLLNNYTGVKPKASAQAKKDQDFEFFKAKIDAAETMEELGAVGREIKQALPMMPAAMRDPLHDAYALRKEAIQNAEDGADLNAAFRATVGPTSPAPMAGRGVDSQAAA